MIAATRAMLRFIAVAFFIFFVGFLGLSLPMFWAQYKILRDWPAVQAEVVRSNVVVVESPSRPLHDIEVEFAYAVNGTPYSGVIHSNHLSTSRARKEKQAERFPVGSRQAIRYNPQDPRDIRAQVGYNVHFFAVPIFVLAVGAIFLVVGLLIWLVSSRGVRAPQAGRP